MWEPGQYTDLEFQQRGLRGQASEGEVKAAGTREYRLYATVTWSRDPNGFESPAWQVTGMTKPGRLSLSSAKAVTGQMLLQAFTPWPAGNPSSLCNFADADGRRTEPVPEPRPADTGYWSIANFVGQGFNVYGDYDMASTTGSLFHFPDGAGHPFTLQGKTFTIPQTVLGTDQSKTSLGHDAGSSRESYQNSLALKANVQAGIGAFSGAVSTSFSQDSTSASDFAFDKYSCITQLGYLDLRIDPANLAPPLVEAIAALPDHADPGNLQPFADFFRQFGVYYVWRVIFGGALELYTAVAQSSGLSTQDIAAEAEASYGALFKAGAKVATSSRRETFAKNASMRVRAVGGNVSAAAKLSSLDTDTPSADSVKLFGDWLDTVVSSPAVVDFRLKGIWELCGDKHGAVETAWALYAQVMHPKLSIQTYSYSDPSLPIVTLGRQLLPAGQAAAHPNGGWQIIILDRSDLSTDAGVKFNRCYAFPPLTGASPAPGIAQTYDAMHGDITGSGCANDAHLLVAVSYGLQYNWGPTGNFFGLLHACGGNARHLDMVKADNVGSGSNLSPWSNYILVGAFNSGTGAGVDYASGSSFKGELTEQRPKLEVLFYRDGVDARYAFGLGSAP